MKIGWSFAPCLPVYVLLCCLFFVVFLFFCFFLNNFLELRDLAGPQVSPDAVGLKAELSGLFALDFNRFIICRGNPFPYSPSFKGAHGIGSPSKTLRECSLSLQRQAQGALPTSPDLMG